MAMKKPDHESDLEELEREGLLKWDKLPRGAERITWDIKIHPDQPEAAKEIVRRVGVDEMVQYSIFAHCIRLHCALWGHHKTCHSAQCRRQGRCATRRPGKPPPEDSLARMFHYIMPICVPKERFFEVRDIARDFLWGPPPWKKR